MTTYQETHKSHWKPSWRMLPRRVRSASSAQMARSSFCNPMQHRSRLLMCRVLTCISIPCRLSTSSTPDGVSNSEYHRAILLNRGSAGCILLTLNPVKNLSCQGTPVGCKASQPVPPGGQVFVLQPDAIQKSPLVVPGVDLHLNTQQVIDSIHAGRSE